MKKILASLIGAALIVTLLMVTFIPFLSTGLPTLLGMM